MRLLLLCCLLGSTLLLAEPLYYEPVMADPQIERLRVELLAAETQLESAQERLEQARTTLYKAQIDLVSERLDHFNRWLEEQDSESPEYQRFLRNQLPTLFAEERAQLATIIDAQVEQSEKAQVLLDRVLAHITMLNNQLREHQNGQGASSRLRWHNRLSHLKKKPRW